MMATDIDLTRKDDGLSDLEWVQLFHDMDTASPQPESMKNKFIRKFKENPLIPVGK